MLNKYIKGEFSEQYNVTVGVEFTSKTIRIDEKTQVKLQIWDTVLFHLQRQGRKLLEPSWDHSTRESVAYFSPFASTTRIASTVSTDGSKKQGKMLMNKLCYFWSELKLTSTSIARSQLSKLMNISSTSVGYFILKQVPKLDITSTWYIFLYWAIRQSGQTDVQKVYF